MIRIIFLFFKRLKMHIFFLLTRISFRKIKKITSVEIRRFSFNKEEKRIKKCTRKIILTRFLATSLHYIQYFLHGAQLCNVNMQSERFR